MTTVRYYLPDDEMTCDDAFVFECRCSLQQPDWVAEEAAKDYERNHEGWEDTWPITIVICDLPNATLEESTFDVDRDFEPVFFAIVSTA